MCITTVEITMMHWVGLAQINHKDVKGVALLNFDPAGINVKADSPWKTVEGTPGLHQGQSWEAEGFGNREKGESGTCPVRVG